MIEVRRKSKPFRVNGVYYCGECNYAVPYGAEKCIQLHEQLWHPIYEEKWNGYWENRAGRVMRKITDTEYRYGIEAEKEYYND